MKINKRFLLLRILASPFKLVFTMVWFNLVGLVMFLKWLKNGGQELFYGDAFGGNLVDLIESNEALVKKLKEQKQDKG